MSVERPEKKKLIVKENKEPDSMQTYASLARE